MVRDDANYSSGQTFRSQSSSGSMTGDDKSVVDQAKEKTGEVVDQAKQTVSDVADQVGQTAQPVVDQAKQTTGEVVDQAKQQAKTQLVTRKDQLAQGLDTLAGALRQTAGDLQKQDQGTVSGYVNQAADRFETISNYLENRDLSDIVYEVESYARRQPALFVGGALLLGVLGARFLKSSSQKANESRYGEYDSAQDRGTQYDNNTVYQARSYGSNDYGYRSGRYRDTGYERASYRGSAYPESSRTGYRGQTGQGTGYGSQSGQSYGTQRTQGSSGGGRGSLEE